MEIKKPNVPTFLHSDSDSDSGIPIQGTQAWPSTSTGDSTLPAKLQSKLPLNIDDDSDDELDKQSATVLPQASAQASTQASQHKVTSPPGTLGGGTGLNLPTKYHRMLYRSAMKKPLYLAILDPIAVIEEIQRLNQSGGVDTLSLNIKQNNVPSVYQLETKNCSDIFVNRYTNPSNLEVNDIGQKIKIAKIFHEDYDSMEQANMGYALELLLKLTKGSRSSMYSVITNILNKHHILVLEDQEFEDNLLVLNKNLKRLQKCGENDMKKIFDKINKANKSLKRLKDSSYRGTIRKMVEESYKEKNVNRKYKKVRDMIGTMYDGMKLNIKKIF
jgi:hypothetical protein